MKMGLNFVLTAVILTPSAAAFLKLWQHNFLGQGMQPDVVAHTLSGVEDEWKAQAAVFAECNSTNEGTGVPSIVNCADAPLAFGKSCGTVVNAIIQGSSGDRDVTAEYMRDVCGQKFLTSWHQQHCSAFAAKLTKLMTADKYENRANFKSEKVCTAFWSQFVVDEQARIAEEKVQQEAAEKKAAEEAAEKERLRLEEEKKEAERKKAEDAARAKQEAEAKAAEAKEKAAEAAAKAAQKKAEAEEVAKAAQQRMEEAEKAVKEHEKILEKANITASENTTVATGTAEVAEPASANATTADSEKDTNITQPEKDANITQPAAVTNATEH